MFRKKGYRIILIVIFLIILTCVSLNIKTYNNGLQFCELKY